MKVNNFLNLVMLFVANSTFCSSTTTTVVPSLIGSSFIEMFDDATLSGPYIILGNTVILGDGINPLIITANINDNYPILYPQGNNISALGINQFGQLTTAAISMIGNVNNNFILCNLDSLGISLDTSNVIGSNINIVTGLDNGNIILKGSQIMTPQQGKSLYLGIDENNAILTISGGSGGDGSFVNLSASGAVNLGSIIDQMGGNIIIPSGGLEMGPVVFTCPSGFQFIGDFPLPGPNETAVMTIDENGKLGILLSSIEYKDNIQKIVFTESDFDLLKPVQYNYKDKEKVEFGLIAEEVFLLQSLKDALVILDKDKIPLTINYQAVLMVLLEQFLIYKKKMNQVINQQNNRIRELEAKMIP